MVDPARVRAKLVALEGYCAVLRELAGLPVEAYVADRAYEGRYLVLAAAQTCIDLANHLIASEGWAPAREFRESFARLGEHDVLAVDHVARLQDLAGLRNRLVHLYDAVDDQLVHAAIADGLDDFEQFARAIAALVADADGPPPPR